VEAADTNSISRRRHKCNNQDLDRIEVVADTNNTVPRHRKCNNQDLDRIEVVVWDSSSRRLANNPGTDHMGSNFSRHSMEMDRMMVVWVVVVLVSREVVVVAVVAAFYSS